MDVLPPLIAYLGSPITIQPAMCAFHYPPIAAQLLAGINPATGDTRRDAAFAQCGATAGIVIAFVRMQLGRPLSWATPRALDGRDGIHGCLQHHRVMHVGCRDRHRQGDAPAVDHKMALRALFAAVRGVAPGRTAPRGQARWRNPVRPVPSRSGRLRQVG